MTGVPRIEIEFDIARPVESDRPINVVFVPSVLP